MDEPINGVAGQNFLQQQMNWWNYKYKLVQQQEIYEIKKNTTTTTTTVVLIELQQ